ncbi:hypothetical protein ACLOJK_037572 [Asimina triloba]
MGVSSWAARKQQSAGIFGGESCEFVAAARAVFIGMEIVGLQQNLVGRIQWERVMGVCEFGGKAGVFSWAAGGENGRRVRGQQWERVVGVCEFGGKVGVSSWAAGECGG